MKKISMIACLTFLWSCGINVPKCDDPQVVETVKELIMESHGQLEVGLLLGGYVQLDSINPNSLELVNIMTKTKNDDIKSCGCEGNFEFNTIQNAQQKITASVKYEAQENSNEDVIVQVNEISN
ncbi:hypothetical protein [Flavobacterium sp. LB2P53]|uniref:hypothetical protein n=1 Tax=Flavobacterium sp. LB2P53 TaxID=2497481 RepID=UPI000F845D07|nr:hypothetical protein [Flavobacterium sp. LB2P53]RTY71193.1 hypothetical protein EKL95_00290 [Flavobacterium sp. LB2P53]